MKIAIPLFGNKVSPRFDLSPELWMITAEDGEVIRQEKISMEKLDIPRRIEKLASSGVDQVICGGIHDFSLEQSRGMGIAVFHNVIGDADIALAIFLKGKLQLGSYCEKEKIRILRDPKAGGHEQI
jgi:predicted Fe-Mo cluster-binding NifX family protein